MPDFHFFFYHEIMKKLWCEYSLESSHRGDSNEYTQHTVFYRSKDTPKLIMKTRLFKYTEHFTTKK